MTDKTISCVDKIVSSGTWGPYRVTHPNGYIKGTLFCISNEQQQSTPTIRHWPVIYKDKHTFSIKETITPPIKGAELIVVYLTQCDTTSETELF